MVEVTRNCRTSYESLSLKTGLSANAIKNRVTSLLENGTISRFSIAFHAAMIDAEFFMAFVITDGTEDIDEFVKRMGENPMIGHISLLASASGGAYLVWGQYIGSSMLSELRMFLQSPPEVTDVELHTILGRFGKKMKLANLHLRILAQVQKDPRATISDIANECGLAAKTVRRAIREVSEGEGVVFSARIDMAAGKLVNFYVRFEWKEDETTLSDIVNWLREKYAVELWDPTPSTTDPILFAEFVVDNLYQVEEIARDIRNHPFVKSTTTLISYSNKKFPYLAEKKLDNVIREAGY